MLTAYVLSNLTTNPRSLPTDRLNVRHSLHESGEERTLPQVSSIRFPSRAISSHNTAVLVSARPPNREASRSWFKKTQDAPPPGDIQSKTEEIPDLEKASVLMIGSEASDK